MLIKNMFHTFLFDLVVLTYFSLFLGTYFNDTHREELFYSIFVLQECIEIEDWLLLTLFICLHNQLSYTHSIVHY